MQKTQILGNKGEALVAEWLQRKGVTILALNYQTKQGEIDLIVKKNITVAFIEVKTRRKKYFPLSTVVTKSKQKKIIRTAKNFIVKNDLSECVLRFDIATLIIEENNNYSIEYIPNAFQDG